MDGPNRRDRFQAFAAYLVLVGGVALSFPFLSLTMLIVAGTRAGTPARAAMSLALVAGLCCLAATMVALIEVLRARPGRLFVPAGVLFALAGRYPSWRGGRERPARS